MQCWDSNPLPSEYVSPPITMRAGLQGAIWTAVCAVTSDTRGSGPEPVKENCRANLCCSSTHKCPTNHDA